jgi:hypothetical protein
MFSIFKCKKTSIVKKSDENSEDVDDPDYIPTSSKNVKVVSTIR